MTTLLFVSVVEGVVIALMVLDWRIELDAGRPRDDLWRLYSTCGACRA